MSCFYAILSLIGQWSWWELL